MPTPEELDAIYAESYHSNSIENNSTNQTSPYQIAFNYASYITKKISHGRPHLDIGAGLGDLVQRVRQLGGICDGVESSAQARNEARVRYNIDLKSVVQDCELEYVSFSLIEVIEHFPDPVDYITRLYDYMPFGSTLLITTPNVRSITSRLLKSKWREIYNKPFHLVMFSKRGLKSMLINCGFKEIVFMPNYHVSLGRISKLRTYFLYHLGLNGSHCVCAKKLKN